MQFPRISLAVKYRILFGAAVLLILGAALYVPWYLMEDLVLEQPAFREAQRIADDYFRTDIVHASLPRTRWAQWQEASGSVDAGPMHGVTTRHQRCIDRTGQADAVVAHTPPSVGPLLGRRARLRTTWARRSQPCRRRIDAAPPFHGTGRELARGGWAL